MLLTGNVLTLGLGNKCIVSLCTAPAIRINKSYSRKKKYSLDPDAAPVPGSGDPDPPLDS